MKLIIEQANCNDKRVFTLSYIAAKLGVTCLSKTSRSDEIIEAINALSKNISAEYKFASKGGKFVASATITGVNLEQVESVLEGKTDGVLKDILLHQLQLHFEPQTSDETESILLLNGSNHPMWILSKTKGVFTAELLELDDLIGEVDTE